MTIASVRFQFYPRRERLRSYLNTTHGGFDDWFRGRLKPIRERLRGAEVKGVDIVNFLLCEPPRLHGVHAQWTKSLNNCQFTWACDLEPLRDQSPLENLERLMRFAGAWADQAPWPQVRAVGEALSQPLTDVERASLQPVLTWPREEWFRKAMFSGPQLELAMANARRDVAPALKEARYLKPGLAQPQ
jgi:hypothetical protein